MRIRAPQHAASTVVGAAAVFAPTSFARLRLIRQMHACGLLSVGEQSRSRELAAAPSPPTAPVAADAC